MTNEDLALFIKTQREEIRGAIPADSVGINLPLIQQYADQYKSGDPAGLANLQTLLDSSRRRELQACRLSEAYLNQIVRMQRDTTEPRRIVDVPSERAGQGQGRPEAAKANPKSKSNLSQNEPKASGKEKPEKLTLDLNF